MSETIAFALSELNRYYNILTADDGLTAEAKVIPEEFSGGFEKYDPFFDDAYIVRAGGGRIDITASNERTVFCVNSAVFLPDRARAAKSCPPLKRKISAASCVLRRNIATGELP